MQVQATAISPHDLRQATRLASFQSARFDDLLNGRAAASGQSATPPQEDDARTASEALVAITLVQPLLEQARKDPFRSDLFHGGFAEDAFGAKLDSIIAERITKASHMPIVESLYSQMTQARGKVDTHG